MGEGQRNIGLQDSKIGEQLFLKLCALSCTSNWWWGCRSEI